MPRKTPTQSIEIIGKLDTQPVKSVAEFFAATENKKYFMTPPRNPFSCELMTFYSDAKTDHEIQQQFFDTFCQKEQKKVNDARNKLEKAAQIELQEKFVHFNDVLRDLDEKRKVAYKKISHELNEQKLLREQIEAKRQSIEDSIIFLDEFKYTTAQYRIYESVLENVVEQTGEFESVKDLISRCDAIMFAHDDIKIMNEKLCDEIELMRKRMTDIIKKANLIALGMKNKLAVLQRSYDATVMECLRWERQYRDHRNIVLTNECNKLRALDAINTLCRLFCKRKGLTPSTYGWAVGKSLEKQLDFVREEYFLATEIIKEYHRRHPVKTAGGAKVKRKC